MTKRLTTAKRKNPPSKFKPLKKLKRLLSKLLLASRKIRLLYNRRSREKKMEELKIEAQKEQQ